MREKKKRSNKNTRYNGVRLKMPMSPRLPTSNNWGWTETLKNSFTLVKFDPLHKKWVAKPISNKSDNTLKKVSDNTLKTRSEWQHTQERWTLQLKKSEHNNSKTDYMKITKDQVGRIERN
jgi:hypothetical protein